VLEDSLSWFALHVRMHEYHNIEKALDSKGYEVFAPTYEPKAKRRRRARVPLFPGYLFCSLDPRQRTPVLTVPGVIRILGLGHSVCPVPTQEIESLRRTVDSGLPLESIRLLEPGEPVVVQSGPLAGVKGVVVYHKGSYRVVITVSALNDRAVAVEVDRSALISLKASSVTQEPQMSTNLASHEASSGVVEDSIFGGFSETTSLRSCIL
jgi:transcription antitermination factor NusG